MEIIGKVSFEVVIHSWLKDEWSNPVYDIYRKDNDLINNPQFANDAENLKRLKIFLHNRLFMYSSILERAEWFEVKLIKKDLNRIYYCCSDEWNKFSNGLFQPIGAYSNIFPDSKIDIVRANKIKEIHTTLLGNSLVNGLILIGTSLDSVKTIVEGNHRFTATSYMLKDKEENEAISDIAYLGMSPEMNNYNFHIGKYNPHL